MTNKKIISHLRAFLLFIKGRNLKGYFLCLYWQRVEHLDLNMIVIEQKGMTFDHDFCYSFSFSSSLSFYEGRERGKNTQSRGFKYPKECLSSRSIGFIWSSKGRWYNIKLFVRRIKKICKFFFILKLILLTILIDDKCISFYICMIYVLS